MGSASCMAESGRCHKMGGMVNNDKESPQENQDHLVACAYSSKTCLNQMKYKGIHLGTNNVIVHTYRRGAVFWKVKSLERLLRP